VRRSRGDGGDCTGVEEMGENGRGCCGDWEGTRPGPPRKGVTKKWVLPYTLESFLFLSLFHFFLRGNNCFPDYSDNKVPSSSRKIRINALFFFSCFGKKIAVFYLFFLKLFFPKVEGKP
jgi:hypothetical protein